MRLLVSRDNVDAADWRFVHLNDAMDGLPDVNEHIDRIYAGDMLDHVEEEIVQPMLELWLENHRVTTRTLMVVLEPLHGGDARELVREAGWGVASNYDLGLLKMDGWPVPVTTARRFALLCRAIKPSTPRDSSSHEHLGRTYAHHPLRPDDSDSHRHR